MWRSKKRNLRLAERKIKKDKNKLEILKKTIQKLASFVRTRESTKRSETMLVNAVITPNISKLDLISTKLVAIKVGW
ncbi:MAG: hypothetical protein O9301_08175 [Leptospira sp.]|nr:hypothetical protein [Leptospira sp.]